LPRRRRRTTIRDVANEAGVSVATVSRALNARSDVAEETRKLVERIADELGYAPNQAAADLRSQTSALVAFVASDINPFIATIARGLEASLAREGYLLTIGSTSGDPTRESALLRAMVARGNVAGVVLATSQVVGRPLIEIRDKSNVPWVLVDNYLPRFRGDTVATDNFHGGYLATRYLIRLGHKDIAIITGPITESSARDRLRGYIAALNEADIPLPRQLLRFGDFRKESGRHNTADLVLSNNPPTAIFACNSEMGIGALYALKELSWRVPEDVSLIVFDEFDEARLSVPEVTVVAQDAQVLGHEAARLLLKKIHGKGGLHEVSRRFAPRLRIRESCLRRPPEEPRIQAAAGQKGR